MISFWMKRSGSLNDFHGLRFAEIGGLLGITKGRVSQIHRQALLLLNEARAALGNVDLSL